MKAYRAGIDIGSTTVKLVLLDENGKILYGEYRRHCAHTQQTLAEMLKEAGERLGDCELQVKITGSGSINLGKALNIGFVQEVVAVANALQLPHRRQTLPSSSAEKMLKLSISTVVWKSA